MGEGLKETGSRGGDRSKRQTREGYFGYAYILNVF